MTRGYESDGVRFAWYPIRICHQQGHQWVWLRRVERMSIGVMPDQELAYYQLPKKEEDEI